MDLCRNLSRGFLGILSGISLHRISPGYFFIEPSYMEFPWVPDGILPGFVIGIPKGISLGLATVISGFFRNSYRDSPRSFPRIQTVSFKISSEVALYILPELCFRYSSVDFSRIFIMNPNSDFNGNFSMDLFFLEMLLRRLE